MLKIHRLGMLTLIAAGLSACSPTFNWRDYRSADAAFHVLFPAKPETFSRLIDLDGLAVTMTMTAAEVDGATFAVGSVELPESGRAPAALFAMRTALLKNIRASAGTADAAQAAAPSNEVAACAAQRQCSIDVEASGASPYGAMQLAGRFVARDKRVYQIIVMSKGTQPAREQIDMFLGSFSLD